MANTVNHSVEVRFGGGYREYEIELDVDVANDGIGAYECHGFRGVDHGTDYVEGWNIEGISHDGKEVDFDKLPFTVRRQIEKKIDAWVESGAAMEQLADQSQAAFEAAEEARYDDWKDRERDREREDRDADEA